MDFSFFIYYAGGIVTYVVVVTGATLLFLLQCRRNNHFVPKFTLSVIAVAALGVLLALVQYAVEMGVGNVILTNIVVIIVYFLLFIAWVVALKWCYVEPLIRLVVAAVLGGLCQNIGNHIYVILNISTNLDTVLYIALYEYGRFYGYVVGQFIQLAIAAAVLTASYYMFAKSIIGKSFSGSDDIGMYVALGLSKIILPILNALNNIFTPADITMRLFVMSMLMICSASMLVLYVKMLQVRSVMNELDILSKLNKSEHEHFLKLKQDMELISIKCHDIKHFIAAAGAKGGIDLSELSEAVKIYDTTIKTGNEVIDTMLAERSLYCSANGITLTVIADASGLDFISVTDMCSLFGNLLENAIEATQKIEQSDKRLININIRPVAGQIFMCVENSFTGEISMADGRLISGKTWEEGFHGFGIKSIKLIAQKYGANFSLGTEDGIFRISLLFPVPLANKA